jgi:MerR family transcriptional regulator, thiopeptide resistance regulator
VTVRTLHHDDEIGLLRPSERSPAGYRLYTRADLDRLQTVVVYRRLGSPLEEVAELLEGGADLVAHLRRQRDAVTSQLDELTGLVEAIDVALEREMTNEPLTEFEKRELFGDAFVDEGYEDEARQRWGESEQWQESRARTQSYSKQEWAQIAAESARIDADAVRLFLAGTEAGSPETMEVAEAHRQHISRWFYACTPEFHPNLGELYVCDPRYTQQALAGHDPAAVAGYPAWLRDAIVANAARQHDAS